jgi:hypothetical protein
MTVTNGRTRSLWLNAMVAAVGVSLGFAAVALPRVLADHDDQAERANPRVGLGDVADSRRDAGASVLTNTGDAEPAGAPGSSPDAAVEQFLAAEIAGDFAASYGLLSAADRRDLGSRAEWTTAHGHLPQLTAYVLGTVDAGPARAEVAAALELEPELDEIVGLVPARADATWVAVLEDGGWRVAFSESSLAPRYPPEDDALVAVRSWLGPARDCRQGEEYPGGLLGAEDLARRLCQKSGEVNVGAVEPLDPGSRAQPFLAAFGPEVFSWARVVPVAAPDQLEVVLAPVGERWLVLGVVEPSPGSST